MDSTVSPPPPLPLLTTATTTTTVSSNDIVLQQQHSPSPSTSTSSSIIIVIMVIASAIIISAVIYLLLRFLSRRCSRSSSSVHSTRVYSPNVNLHDIRIAHEQHHQHSISIDSNNNSKLETLPTFTFSSLTGKIPGGDCAVCLSKFEPLDQLRLLPVCCHAFHVECIDAWLKSNQTCPLCRSSVNPTEDDIMNKIHQILNVRERNESFRIEIGSISTRRSPADSGRRSYSVRSYEYVLDEGYEVPVESTHRRDVSGVDKDTAGALALPLAPELPVDSLTAEVGSGRRNWLRDYVDRVSASISSRSHSFRGSGRFFTGSSRRSEVVDDFEATHSRVGEEISEVFRWLSGV